MNISFFTSPRSRLTTNRLQQTTPFPRPAASPKTAPHFAGQVFSRESGAQSQKARQLYEAIKDKNYDLASDLLSRNANPNWEDSSGETPLYRLVRYASTNKKQQMQEHQLFQRLLEQGAGATDKNLVLRYLVLKEENNALPKVCLLLQAKADPSWQENNDWQRETAFDFALNSARLLNALNQNQVNASFKQKFLSQKLKPGDQFEQNNIGDCYFLAAMDCVMNSPFWMAFLDRIWIFKLKASPDRKLYRVKFPTGSAYRPVTVKASVIGQHQGDRKPVQGPKYLQLLELAYASLIQQFRNTENGNLEHEGNPFELVDGGYAQETLHHLLGGEKFLMHLDKDENLKDFLKAVRQDSEKVYLLTMATPPKSTENKGPIVLNLGQKTIQLPRSHAYSVRNFDLSNQTITIVDPHHSKNKAYDLTLNQCAQIMDWIKGIKLLKKDLE
jgi:hypothetical protein